MHLQNERAALAVTRGHTAPGIGDRGDCLVWWLSDSSDPGFPLLVVCFGASISLLGKWGVGADRTDPLGLLFGMMHMEPQGMGRSSQGPVHLSKPRTQRKRQEVTRSSRPRAGILSPRLQIIFTSEALKFLSPGCTSDQSIGISEAGVGAAGVLKLPGDTNGNKDCSLTDLQGFSNFTVPRSHWRFVKTHVAR